MYTKQLIKKSFNNEYLLGFFPISEGRNIGISKLKNLLTEEEKRKYTHLSKENRKLKFLLSRIMLRKILTILSEGKIPPRQWKFKQNEFGKPLINTSYGLPDFSFSISYSGDLVVIAASANNHIGIDIEIVTDIVPDISAALTPKEICFLSSLSEEQKKKTLLQIWTIKEAFTKLIGLGFGLDFQDFEVFPKAPSDIIYFGKFITEINPLLITRSFFYDSREYVLSLAISKKGGIKFPPYRST